MASRHGTYVPLYIDVWTHPKTLALANAIGQLGYPRRAVRREAVGQLHELVGWALDQSNGGRLDHLTPDLFARIVGWDDPRKANRLWDAWLASGFLDQLPDGRIFIHEFEDFAAPLLAKRADAQRKRDAYRRMRGEESPRNLRGETPEKGAEVARRNDGDRPGISTLSRARPDRTVPDIPPNPPEGGAHPGPPEGRVSDAQSARRPKPEPDPPPDPDPPHKDAPDPAELRRVLAELRVPDAPGPALDAVAAAIVRAGWAVERGVPIENRGDGRAGRLDLLATRGNMRIAIEVDGPEPRERSVARLRSARTGLAWLLLRGADPTRLPPRPEGPTDCQALLVHGQAEPTPPRSLRVACPQCKAAIEATADALEAHDMACAASDPLPNPAAAGDAAAQARAIRERLWPGRKPAVTPTATVSEPECTIGFRSDGLP